LTAVCVYVAKTLGCTIEYVLEHNIEWINHVSTVIAERESEESIFRMRLHGADDAAVARAQGTQSKRQVPKGTVIIDEDADPVAQMRAAGIEGVGYGG